MNSMTTKAVLAVGGVGLKKGRIVNAQKAMISLAYELNPYLQESDFLKDAPFCLVSFIFRYGEKFSQTPDIDPIDLKNKELPVAAEVPMDELRTSSVDDVKRAFAGVLLPALTTVAEYYSLPKCGLERFCTEHGYNL